MYHDDPGGRLRYGGSKDFTGMHEGAVQQPTGDQNLAKDLALAIQRKEMEFLDLEIPQPRTEQANHIFGFPDPLHRRALLPRRSDPQLKGCQKTGGLGRTYSRGAEELSTGPLCQAAQGPVCKFQQPSSQLEHILATSPGT
jgi:hypothetical protein